MTALEQFGIMVLAEARDSFGDIDGGWIQDAAETLGLLVRIQVTVPCGEECRCAEYGEFPQECLRPNPEIEAAITEASK
jgi:hypothetical protein